MNKRRILIAGLSLLLLTVASVVGLCAHALYERKTLLVITGDGGIYDGPVVITVDTYAPGTVYYTMNGRTPGPDAEGVQVYEGPIRLEPQEETATYSFQFRCLFNDGTQSDIYKRDYILDSRGTARFTTTYVVSVTGTEEDLFGYERGLFVRGRQFDEYMQAHPDANLLTEIIPANYMSEEEVAVHAAVFRQDGTQVVNQDCGLKISGNSTMAKNQRSFRLIARHEYDTANEFSYAFLPKLVSEESGRVIDKYQRINLHNAGDDHGYGFIRTQLIGELARQWGFPDVLVAESATVYVNGRYQGVYWLQNRYDDRYFKEKYGNYEGEMVICKGSVSHLFEESAETESEKQCLEEYNAFCQWAQEADLQEDGNWQRVCDTIDVENFARYVAIEYYVANTDWPQNNVKVYRYMTAEDETYREGTVFDGRYRYLLFDTDYGMGLKFQGWYGGDAFSWILEDLCNFEDSRLFGKLLEREEFRELFVCSVASLMGGSFHTANVGQVLEEYNAKRFQELEYMMEETDLLKDSLWEPDDNGIDNVEEELAEILVFGEKRIYTVTDELDYMWGCGGRVRLAMGPAPDCVFILNGLRTESVYDGYCFENVPLEIRCEAPPGYTLRGYYVNAGFQEGESLEILPREWQDEDERILIEPVFDITPVERLEIVSYDIGGTQDCIVLRNSGQTTLLLSDYALGDSEDRISEGKLPGLELAPGEEHTVYGAKYSGEMEEGSTQLSFSWKKEEPVLLFHVSEGVVDSRNRGLK